MKNHNEPDPLKEAVAAIEACFTGQTEAYLTIISDTALSDEAVAELVARDLLEAGATDIYVRAALAQWGEK